MKQFKER